jgi:DNA-binding response OmpR family regulator
VPKRILIVEDDDNILISLNFLMTNRGYDTRTCGNGQEAVTIAAGFRPHLVLLDIMLPGQNGYEVCRTLRGNPDHANIKIVVLSAKGRDAEIARAQELGADAYLTKPFSTRDVTDTVRRLIESP